MSAAQPSSKRQRKRPTSHQSATAATTVVNHKSSSTSSSSRSKGKQKHHHGHTKASQSIQPRAHPKSYRIETSELTQSNIDLRQQQMKKAHSHNPEYDRNSFNNNNNQPTQSAGHLGSGLNNNNNNNNSSGAHLRTGSLLSDYRGQQAKQRQRSKKEEKKWRKKMKEIGRRHPEFELTYDLLLGIRTSTSLMSQSVLRSSVNRTEKSKSGYGGLSLHIYIFIYTLLLFNLKYK